MSISHDVCLRYWILKNIIKNPLCLSTGVGFENSDFNDVLNHAFLFQYI